MLRSCPPDFHDRVIHGDRFAAMADVEVNRNANGMRIERGVARLGRGARIAFVKTDFVPGVLASLRELSDPEPFVLITHNSDLPITRQLFERAPPCVARWYALNVDHEALNLVPIPSGMERPHGGGSSADYAKVPEAWRGNAGTSRRYTGFGCWNPRNNAAERARVRQALDERRDFVWREHGLGHLEFLQLCGQSRFVVSPPGHGIDCHRTWEAMYMGAIPLVNRSHHTDGFNDLPMVLVDDWNTLTDDVLSRTFERYDAALWDYEKLFFSYWERLIRRDARSL